MKSIIILSSLLLGALGFPADSHVVHEKRTAPRQHYARGEPAHADTKLPVQFALKQSNIAEGAQRLYDISNPKSANYGKHMTAREAIDFFAADEQTITTVTKWLEELGVGRKGIVLDNTRTVLYIESTVAKMEKMLQTRYHLYESKITGRSHIGVEEYRLPMEIASLVDFVYPAVSLGRLHRRDDGDNPAKDNPAKDNLTTKKPAAEEPATDIPAMDKPATDNPATDKADTDKVDTDKAAIDKAATDHWAVKEPVRALEHDMLERLATNQSSIGCDQIITPQCIRDMYNIPLENNPEFLNYLGIWETGDTFDQEDLDLFLQNFAPNVPKGTKPHLALINGATAPVRQADGGGESLLDLDIAYPIIQPQNIIVFQNKPIRNAFSQFFADWASAVDRDFCSEDPNFDRRLMCGKYKPSNVMSVSYGDAEMDEPIAIVQRVCNEFMKLGNVGVTVVVSSGDTGVASRQNECAGPHHDIFTPSFLSVCPFVTSVGSTVLPEGRSVGEAEVVTTSFSPGGGFSNYFERPSYQEDAVSNDTRGIYNRAGRAYPDVSALGDNGLVVTQGRAGLSGGTSMSSPIVAAIFNRINDARMSAGKGPIGFANPALYDAARIPGFYNDVTEGNQALGGIESDRGLSACGNDGFSAVPGWDPVSGLGTPNYEAWVQYFLEL